ncbi:MAG: polyketide synthase dehydratase domain-containing protein [Deltaproteobacteria bacterium]|nr:polyketide synthase dehydratase domain-containing protein [Deltaproteobacteria bacterium]
MAWLFHTAQLALADVRSGRGPNTGAIFGNLSFPTGKMAELFEAPHLGHPAPDPRSRFMSGLPALLLEEHLKLEAGALALDAACASSLYAIKLAIDALADGRADLMLAGAVNCADDLFIHVGFTALQALSKTGQSRPFEAKADGLVPAEGAAFLALKRLEDARRDGDRIWAVIRGVGLSNDGRGRGFLAPMQSGQVRAMRAAFAGSGLSPQDISLMECHATGTSVGDGTELSAITEVYAGHPDLPLGSLKSNLGHLITAAGVAGVIKVIQAMEAGVRPPTLHVQEPHPGLQGTPLRVLQAAEPWKTSGPKRAAVSAFGFGGNNAHLLLEEHDPSLAAPTQRARSAQKVAIVGVGIRAGDAKDRETFAASWFEGRSIDRRMVQVDLPQAGLRFPPTDLAQTLPQQLAMMAAADEAVRDRGEALPGHSTVVVGMGTDPEVCRYGLRWRLAESSVAKAGGPEWLRAAQDAVVPVLRSAGVVGTMPNVVANRLSSHFGLEGPGFTVSAEERSGLEALAIAARSLEQREVDVALVGAVELSSSDPNGSDAAVAVVLERLEDAQAAGRKIYAVLDELPRLDGSSPDPHLPQGPIGGAGAESAASPSSGAQPGIRDRAKPRVGEPSLLPLAFHGAGAARGLLEFTALALSLARRRQPDGAVQLSPVPRVPLVVHPMAGSGSALALSPGPEPVPPLPQIGLYTYAAADRAGLQVALQNDRPGGDGPVRAVVVAANPAERREKAIQLAARVEAGQPGWPGARWAEEPLGGKVGFIYAAAGATYHGMGRSLLAEWPRLLPELAARFESLPEALGWAYATSASAPNPLQRLFGAAALGQLHTRLATTVLGLQPQAILGYSSGESSSLMAFGVWRDLEAMYQDAKRSRLFEARPDWATWSLRASPEEVQVALQNEPRAYLGIIHSDRDCVVSGEPSACERVIGRLGKDRARRIDYDLWVHVPEAQGERDRWLALHNRETFAPKDLVVYSNAHHGPYEVSQASCQVAVSQQAIEPLDLRPTIRRAYQDGVRTFIEFGPRGAVSTWIREILGDAPVLAVALDDEGGGRARLYDVVAQLWCHGVQVNLQNLGSPAEAVPTLRFPAHRGSIVLPPLPNSTHTPLLAPAQPAPQVMAPAPTLPPILEVPPPADATSNVATSLRAAPASIAPDLRNAAPSASASGPSDARNGAAPSASGPSDARNGAPASAGHSSLGSSPAAVHPESTPVATAHGTNGHGSGPADHAPRAFGAKAAVAPTSARTMIALAHQAFLESQSEAHQHFLSERQRALALLQRSAAGPSAAPWTAPVSASAPRVEARSPSASAPSVPSASPLAPSVLTKGPSAPPAPASTPALAPVPRAVPAPEVQVVLHSGPPAYDRRALQIHAGGKISEIFGPLFKEQDAFPRQVRMPEPPLLLADRVMRLDAEAGSMGKGTIVTQTDVKWGELYLHEGRMSPGLMIEAGQADLMLISYLGIDRYNRGERVYRLLGCELTYHGDAPTPGETLEYQIHVDGHAQQGDIRLFFFHYDCTVNGQKRLSVRQGQAGFFSDQELAESAGVLWSPETQEIVKEPRLDPPAIPGAPSAYDEAALQAFAEGRGADCFGEGFEYLRTHVRTPRIPTGDLLLLDRVTRLDPKGGPWKRGYLEAELDIQPDDWFFAGHFKGDPCMPGTLMFDGCIQAMSFYLSALGFTVARDGHRFQPVPGHAVPLRCRGQVTPKSQKLRYEIFVEELEAGPEPTLWADVLCTVDGLKAFHARRLGIRLVPDWPLTSRPQLLADYQEPEPIAKVGDFELGYPSLLACAWGRPSEAFGEMYKVFDGTRRVARLPGPPYHFMSRVRKVDGPIGVMKAGAKVEIAYDIPKDVWYFDANGARVMPFAVLLEAALQPCGWLASYVGSALTADEDLSFRNLDGTGKLLVDLVPDSGTFVTKVALTNVSKNGSTIIESFAVECFVGETKIYELNTVFGFFPKAALENQVGLPTTDEERQRLHEPSTFHVELTARPSRYCAGPARLADERLLMLDRVTGYWPEGGPKGLGRLRAEKDVDADEWFFKAHFFQDPVQPGSLGIEAMIQLLQFYMLERGMDAGIEAPRFQSLELGRPMTWKYRGQVVPKNKVISTTLDVVEVGQDALGPYAVATASLWVDGKRIYEAKNLGMRIVSDPGAGSKTVTRTLDPAAEPWIQDHCPTFTVPALPMTGVLERLAAIEPQDRLQLADVRLLRWITVEKPITMVTRREAERVVLAVDGQDVASAQLTRDPGPRPAPLPALDAPLQPSPYESAALFHGPSFQRLKVLRRNEQGASAILDASGGVQGGLHLVLLDAATHPIDHEGDTKVYYPAQVRRYAQWEGLPTAGEVRCEVRSSAPNGPTRTHHIQLIFADRVLAEMELVEAGFPKGRLGQHAPLARRDFLLGRSNTGVALSREDGPVTVLSAAEVKGTDWLPGTVARIYGTTDPTEIAVKEHWARHTGLHPRHLPQALPLTRFPLRVTPGAEVKVQHDTPPTLDLSSVRSFWREWFGRGPWPIEDLYYGLIERFVEKVVIADPLAFEAIKGKSVLYLANHQVAIESLLFSVLASAVQGRVTVTLAKIEHQTTWVGELIRRSFSYPQIRDPGVIEFFDRSDQGSLPEVIAGLRSRLAERSLMVHVEGTRSLQCKDPVRKMSGAFIDLALATQTPIVPVRFVGALPVEPLSERLERPVGAGRQSIWLGAPLYPQDLAGVPYGERKARVINAINALGPRNQDEVPNPPNPKLAERITQVGAQLGVDPDRAALASVFLDDPPSTPESSAIRAALLGQEIPAGPSAEWAQALVAWLRGGPASL